MILIFHPYKKTNSILCRFISVWVHHLDKYIHYTYIAQHLCVSFFFAYLCFCLCFVLQIIHRTNRLNVFRFLTFHCVTSYDWFHLNYSTHQFHSLILFICYCCRAVSPSRDESNIWRGNSEICCANSIHLSSITIFYIVSGFFCVCLFWHINQSINHLLSKYMLFAYSIRSRMHFNSKAFWHFLLFHPIHLTCYGVVN